MLVALAILPLGNEFMLAVAEALEILSDYLAKSKLKMTAQRRVVIEAFFDPERAMSIQRLKNSICGCDNETLESVMRPYIEASSC